MRNALHFYIQAGCYTAQCSGWCNWCTALVVERIELLLRQLLPTDHTHNTWSQQPSNLVIRRRKKTWKKNLIKNIGEIWVNRGKG